MKKYLRGLFFSLSLAFSAFAQQNLVPNPSFEADSSAPIIQQFNWRHYANWRKDSLTENNKYILTKSWSQATDGTPDFLNSRHSSLFGFSTQTARTGKCRFGIIAGLTKNCCNSWLLENGNYSEYLETVLIKPLEAGKIYAVQYYVSLDKRSHFAANNFGAIVSKEAINQMENRGTLLGNANGEQLIASDNHYITSDEGWVLVCDTFIANGGERFLTIGSFMDGYAKNRHEVKKSLHKNLRWMAANKEAYYYVDDVSLVEIKSGEQICGAARDSIARNNIVILVDVSGSMEQKKFIDSVKISTLDFIRSLNPADLVSIIAFNADTQVLVSCRNARDTAEIRQALEHIKTGGATNIGLALQAAYGQVHHHPLNPGNNMIILITDGRVHISADMKKIMLNAAKNENVNFSIIFLGKLVPDDMEKLASDLGGNAQAAVPNQTSSAMMKQAPANAVTTPYGTQKVGKIILWHTLTKIFFPVIFVGMLLMKITSIA